MDEALKGFVGPTGDYPEGKLNEHDEGGLMLAIGIEDGLVRIEFGTPVAWLAFRPAHAMAIAMSLLSKVQQLEDENARANDAANRADRGPDQTA